MASLDSGEVADLRQRLRVETGKLDAIRELGRVLGAMLDLDQLLPVLLTKTTELLDAERATLFLVEPSGGLTSVVTLDERADPTDPIGPIGPLGPITLAAGEGIAGWVAQTGATVNLPDAYADPRFSKDFDQRSGFRTRSMLCMPLANHPGRVLGVVQVLNKRGRAFDADDEALLATVAAHASVRIESAQLHRAVIRERDLLVELEREAQVSLDLDEFLDRLLGKTIQLLDAEAGAVLLRERAGGELYFRSTAGASASALERTQLPAGVGIVGWVAQKRRPLLVNDPANDPRHDAYIAEKVGLPARNLIAVPLLHASADEYALGAIEVLNRRSGAGFDEDDLKLLTLIAGQASRAIVLQRGRDEKLHQDRLASIGQMMSGVLHDLKTPMTIASGYAQLMVSVAEEEERKRLEELILKQFDHMSAMTREVLSFARGESNLWVRKVYLQKFVEEMKLQLERELAGSKVRLVVDARYLGVAHFDELKLFRLVHNLARNSAQAMDDGGTFTVIVESDGANLLFTFSDTGRGVPDPIQGRLFEVFATSGKRDGTGLGLAIVKKIVDDHGGRITWETRAGAGTTFRVALPLQSRLG